MYNRDMEQKFRAVVFVVLALCLVLSGYGAVSGIAMPQQMQVAESKVPPCHQEAGKKETSQHSCCERGMMCKCCPSVMGVLSVPVVLADVVPVEVVFNVPSLDVSLFPEQTDPPPRMM